jgi:hypothetical protein
VTSELIDSIISDNKDQFVTRFYGWINAKNPICEDDRGFILLQCLKTIESFTHKLGCSGTRYIGSIFVTLFNTPSYMWSNSQHVIEFLKIFRNQSINYDDLNDLWVKMLSDRQMIVRKLAFECLSMVDSIQKMMGENTELKSWTLQLLSDKKWKFSMESDIMINLPTLDSSLFHTTPKFGI